MENREACNEHPGKQESHETWAFFLRGGFALDKATNTPISAADGNWLSAQALWDEGASEVGGRQSFCETLVCPQEEVRISFGLSSALDTSSECDLLVY